MIKYLKNNEIDKVKWDETIKKSPANVIYAYSWYLDKITPDWDALIENDYETVMPLPIKKKYGLYYILQPFLAQQLGIFSTKKITSEKITEFLKNIPKKVILICINLNTTNNKIPKSFNVKWKTNLLLSLNKPYEELFNCYNRLRKRSLNIAIREGLEITENVSIKTFLNFIENNLPENVRLSYNQLKISEELFKYLYEKNKLILTACKYKEELVGALAGIIDDKKITLSLFASNKIGKEKNAPTLLIDYFIKKFSNQNIILDFAGSSVENIKFFFKTFNPVEVKYPVLFISKIPFLKIFK